MEAPYIDTIPLGESDSRKWNRENRYETIRRRNDDNLRQILATMNNNEESKVRDP